MRLDFNVLWVDDQPERINAQIKPIAKQMEEEGFEFKPTLCRTMDEVYSHIGSDVFNDEVDLILVDWDLGAQLKGQDAIIKIREKILYKDVVFYSAQTVPDELRKLVFNTGLEGIFCASREDLVDEVVGVFESLVKKVLDLDHARGIVMGATSDIDFMVSECLMLLHKKYPDAGKQEMLQKALKRIKEKLRPYQKNIDKLLNATTFEEVLEAHFIFTANDRLRMLNRELENGEHDDKRQMITNYMETVVPDRNILGHQVLQPDGKPTEIIDNRGNKVKIDEIRQLRRLILRLRQDFRSLLEALR